MQTRKQKNYKVCAIYDTETTNIPHGNQARAFPILFIVNDLRDVSISKYEVDKSDHFYFYRHSESFLNFINNLIDWGVDRQIIPVVCAYNLMFDLKPLLYQLKQMYDIQCNAQSSTHVYTFDLIDRESGEQLLRFWDTFFMESNGLKAMGDVCGIAKATGDWDYNLIRTPSTPITDEEIFYAKRDVQVIPAFLRHTLNANPHIKEDMFGICVITKTSLVRQFAKRKIGNLKHKNAETKKTKSQFKMFELLCEKEKPKNYDQYATRKACFRGGLTFTSANTAFDIMQNVASLDVCSMHHAFINGRALPVEFNSEQDKLYKSINTVLNTSREQVIANYYKPFSAGFHALIEFENIKLKTGSAFDRYGIATLASAKFRTNVHAIYESGYNEPANIADDVLKLAGFRDLASGGVFAFSKLYSATKCAVWVNELELWIMSRVYEWDSATVIYGESTVKFEQPPDYVTLQSNWFYKQKNEVKQILKKYKEGTPYTAEVSDLIPTNIKKKLKNGTLTEDFLEAYYIKTVKGNFNSIYGTQAQDIYKPTYKADRNGNLDIDENTKPTRETFEREKDEKKNRVLYTYGMRIVGGSRLHLVLAIELLFEYFDDRIEIVAGDTDSLKISCAEDVKDDEFLDALRPLHDAIECAILRGNERIRRNYPTVAGDLSDVGKFEVEDCGGSTRYKYQIDYWNKARISIDQSLHAHVTFAGLPRPAGVFNIENFIEHMFANNNPADVLKLSIGFNSVVDVELAYTLETHQAQAQDVVKTTVTDYLGNSEEIEMHESNALYPVPRFLGSVEMFGNMQTLTYLESVLHKQLEKRLRFLSIEDNRPVIKTASGELLLEGEKIETL